MELILDTADNTPPLPKAPSHAAEVLKHLGISFLFIILLVIPFALMMDESVQASINRWSENMFDGPKSLSPEKLKAIQGRYYLSKMILYDKEDGMTVSFVPNVSRPVYVVGRLKPIKTRLSLDMENSVLDINSDDICSFSWKFKNNKSWLNDMRTSIGSMFTSGSEKKFGCLRDNGKARVPYSMMPFNKVKYTAFKDNIVFVSVDDQIEQTIYFTKSRAIDAKRAIGMQD